MSSSGVLNAVQFAYNGFGQLNTEYQSTGGSVNTSTTSRVEYDHASGADNTIRPTLLTYPNGRELAVDYGTAGGMDDLLSRVSSLVDDDDTTLAAYSYLGLGSVVQQSSPEADLLYTLADLNGTDDPTTGDIYSGLDRFGRIKDYRWYNTDAESDLSRIQYGYNRASSRLWRKNDSDPNHEHDWLYSYDGPLSSPP